MTLNLKILRNFGLHNNDIAVYETLIRDGETKTGPLIRKTGIVSSRVYESLSTLLKKGLVSYQVKNNIRYYRAESPAPLIDEVRTNEEELRKLTTDIEKTVSTITNRNEVNLFEGKRGFKKAFLKHVEKLSKKDSLDIISFSPRLTDSKELWSFLRSLDNSFLQKKCPTRMLLDQRISKDMEKYRRSLTGYEVRFMPSGYFSPAAVNISKHEVMLSVWGDEPLVVSIKNPVIIKSFAQNFDFLWDTAKPWKR